VLTKENRLVAAWIAVFAAWGANDKIANLLSIQA
jgi:hypothetical protein